MPGVIGACAAVVTPAGRRRSRVAASRWWCAAPLLAADNVSGISSVGRIVQLVAAVQPVPRYRTPPPPPPSGKYNPRGQWLGGGDGGAGEAGGQGVYEHVPTALKSHGATSRRGGGGRGRCRRTGSLKTCTIHAPSSDEWS